MSIDFPTNPAEFQEFWSSYGVRYIFRGGTWITVGGGEPPDARYVNVSGDTMLGQLAVQYPAGIYNALNIQAGDDRYVLVSGDTMAGPLTINPPGALYLHGNAGVSNGYSYSPVLSLQSDWQQCYLQAWHRYNLSAGLYLVVGSPNGKLWNFDNAGNLYNPGHVIIPRGTWLGIDGAAGSAGLTIGHDSTFVLQVAPNYYMARYNNGQWTWVDNGSDLMRVTADGNLWAKRDIQASNNLISNEIWTSNQIHCGTHVALNNGGFVGWGANSSYVMRDGNGHFFLHARHDYRCYWDHNDGGWRWQGSAGFAVDDMRLSAGGYLYARTAVTAGDYMVAPNGVEMTGWRFRTELTGHGGENNVNIYMGGGWVTRLPVMANLAAMSMNGSGFNTRDGGAQYWSISMNVSDERRKRNFAPVEGDSLAIINALVLRSFDYIDIDEHTSAGLTAQQTQAVDPSLVYEFGHPHAPQLNINLYKLLGRAIGAIQKLTDEVEALKAQIAN